MADFDVLEYIKKYKVEEEDFNVTDYISKNRKALDADIPTLEDGELDKLPEKTRELNLFQKGVNWLGDIASGGGQKAYSEYATPEEIEAEKPKNVLKASAEVPLSIGGDLLALASASAGTVYDSLDGKVDEGFGERFATSTYRPEISEKGQQYKEKVLENLGALGPMSGELGAVNRLKPVQGAPAISRANPAVNKVVETTSKAVNAPVKAVGAVVDKGSDLARTGSAYVANKINRHAPKWMPRTPNETTSKWMMTKALNPTISQHQSGAGKRAVNYMLEHRQSPNAKAVTYIEADLANLNKQVDDLIDLNKHKTIRKRHIFNNLDEARNRFKEQVNNVDDLKAFDKVLNNFKSQYLNKPIDLRLAHRIKKNTYAHINKKYGELSSATVEAEKTIARLIKEEIERLAVPKIGGTGIKELNSKLQQAMDTLDVVTRRQFLESKKPLFHGLALLAHDPLLASAQHFQSGVIPYALGAKFFNSIAKDAPVSSSIMTSVKSPYLLGKTLHKDLNELDKLRALGLLGRPIQYNED